MKIAFLTTQSPIQSTLIGRVLPLAQEFQKKGDVVRLFIHREQQGSPTDLSVPTRIIGPNPFSREENGKKRHQSLALLWVMKINALRAAWGLLMERPDIVVLVKPLPENTLAILLAKLFLWNTKVVLDVDDFELFANNLSSRIERFAIHASERIATKLASHIVVATPFLYDHMHQMVAGKKAITIIPTGLTTNHVYTPHTGGNTILYAGSVSTSSGHLVHLLPEILTEVRKEISDARLIIAGSGDDMTSLRKNVQNLHLEEAIEYAGRFSLETIGSSIEKSDILIDPIDASIVNRAKSSFRTALSLVCGMPIITSNIGIRTELIPEEFHERFFAIPDNVSSYASKLIACLTHPLSKEERNILKSKAHQYDWDVLSQKYHEILV